MIASSAELRIACVSASRSRLFCSARRRTTYWPIRLPSTAIEESSRSSGSWNSPAKNSITPQTCVGARIGKANAAPRPERAPALARGKFASVGTSGIHDGSPSPQTLPGKPSPGASASRRVSSTNSSASASGACQTATQRSARLSGVTSQTAPSCHPRPMPMAARTLSYVLEASSASASVRATASSIESSEVTNHDPMIGPTWHRPPACGRR